MTVLTKRQARVLEFVSNGATNEEVAQHLHLSQNTVKSHMAHIFDRLDVQNRWHAVAVALRQGEIR